MAVFLDLKSAMQWSKNEGLSHESLTKFLLEKMINNDLKLDITVDRPLKEGWKKNAPEETAITEIKKLLKRKSS